MKKYDLSIIVPGRNEMFFSRTIENFLKNIRGNTEIIVVLDGAWANPGIPNDPRVSVIYHNQARGQRGAQNEAVRLSQAKYIMKIDAHCTIDEGMDQKMLDAIAGHDSWTMVPKMYNLHAFDWVCSCGFRKDQGPTIPCPKCGSKMKRDVMFEPRWNRENVFYRFNKDLKFQYWGAFKHRPEGLPDIAPSLSLQGSCFMLSREKYWELNICDENHGSWGQQGTEVALKTWMSGGQVMVNKKTWYAHMFRTQGGDFGFPYPLSGADTNKAREYSKKLFLSGGYKAKLTLDQVLEKFRPVPEWHEPIEMIQKKVSKGAIYYSSGICDQNILEKVRDQIKKGMKEKHIVSSTLYDLKFGKKNIPLDEKPGYLTMVKQILTALNESDADVIFFLEHDVLYHPSHFDFIPPREDAYYYNTNVWRARQSDGHALWCDNLQQLSGLVAYRKTLINHFKKRFELLARQSIALEGKPEDFNRYVRSMGFEPGTHNRSERIDELPAISYMSKFPNVDIRHDENLTPSRWNKDQFRNERYTKGWKESTVYELPGWSEYFRH